MPGTWNNTTCGYTVTFLLLCLLSFPFREGLHQFMWEAAHRSAVIPSVLWHQARAETLHWVHGRRGKTIRVYFIFHMHVLIHLSVLACLSVPSFSWDCPEHSPAEWGIGEYSWDLVLCLVLAAVAGQWVRCGDCWGWLETLDRLSKTGPLPCFSMRSSPRQR